MDNTNQEDKFPILEQSTDERIISYGIYINDVPLYPDHKYVLLKYISFPPSKVIQRDEGFAIILNDIKLISNNMVSQGFAMFNKSPSDPTELVCSFM